MSPPTTLSHHHSHGPMAADDSDRLSIEIVKFSCASIASYCLSSTLYTMTHSIPSVPDSISDVSAVRTATTFQWQQVIELGYIESADGDGANVENEEAVCFHCGKMATGVAGATLTKLLKCSRCQVASYWCE